MIDLDSIWRTQDEIRTVVNAVLGECIWNLTCDEGEIPHDILKDCWKYSHIVQILRIIH